MIAALALHETLTISLQTNQTILIRACLPKYEHFFRQFKPNKPGIGVHPSFRFFIPRRFEKPVLGNFS